MQFHGSLSIGDLARAAGSTVETVRYYERIGILPEPARIGTGMYRAYSPGHLARLSFIRRARDLGFSLEQVRDLLALADEKDRPCETVDRIARDHLIKVERKIRDLQALRAELRSLVGQCREGTVAECRIVEALGPAPFAGTRGTVEVLPKGIPNRGNL